MVYLSIVFPYVILVCFRKNFWLSIERYRLLDEEGFYVGASSALNVVAAVQIAKNLGPGHTIVTILADTAGRYQTRLFSRAWIESKGLLEAVPSKYRSMLS